MIVKVIAKFMLFITLCKMFRNNYLCDFFILEFIFGKRNFDNEHKLSVINYFKK